MIVSPPGPSPLYSSRTFITSALGSLPFMTTLKHRGSTLFFIKNLWSPFPILARIAMIMKELSPHSRPSLPPPLFQLLLGARTATAKLPSERGPTFGPAHPVQKVHIKNHQTLYTKGVGMFASEIGTACELQSTGFISSNAASMMKERQILVHMLTKKCLKHQMLELHPTGIQEDTSF